MDTPSSTSESGEGGVMMLRKTNPSLPKLSLPPRTSAEAALKGPNAVSPGPMTFISSLFADDPYADQKSFSHLLSGVIPSPTSDTKNGYFDIDADGGLARAPMHSARFKSMVPSKLPIRRSPCLTIPPGLSPTTLLDSPVLFSTAQVQPSPTTGSYQLPTLTQQQGGSNTYGNMKLENDDSQTFYFKPYPQEPISPVAGMGGFALSHQQAPAQAQTQAQSLTSTYEAPSLPLTYGSSKQSHSQSPTAPIIESVTEPSQKAPPSQAMGPTHPLPQLVERPSEDGYNWRKYGQKQVKGSEYPRSYYKCTYPSCHVKKKVERSYDGQITEIVYKGEHNHPKPQATRRMAMANREALQSMAADRSDAYGNATDLSSAKGHCNGLGASEHSQGSISDDEADEGEASKDDENGEDDGDFKRRKIDNSNEPLSNAPLRTVREPRVVVQTTSDVDILDDGYRWRKYGQKVVKGNNHPRSYYKCTNVGCSVRKHVERSSKDSKAVITTYEGKHNHDVPLGRHSHNDTSTTSAPRALGPTSETSNLGKPAVSLQEQLLGKQSSIGVEAGYGGHDAWVVEQGYSHKGSEQYGVRMMGSNPSGYSRPQEDACYQQGSGLVPKEEPGVVRGSLQPIYQAGQSSSFASRIRP
eukprot:c20251_g2_i1 orf=337-2250(-)